MAYANSEYDPKAMDAAAEAAVAELATFDQAAVLTVAQWFSTNYMKAGHKRLGRALVKIAKNAKVKE